MASVLRHHPDLPIKVIEADPALGLMNKAKMYEQTEFETTLFLDADTVVMGNLDYGFRAAERHGMACCIGECPWLRRYGKENEDSIEYNTGVIFFCHDFYAWDRTNGSTPHFFKTWERLVPRSPGSKWRTGDEVVGLEKDDQWSFSQAMLVAKVNPHVLPLNWNFRPGFHTRFMTPLKVWHSIHEPAPGLEEFSGKAERGEDLITFCTLQNAPRNANG